MRYLARWLGFYLLRYGVGGIMDLKVTVRGGGNSYEAGTVDLLDYIKSNL